MFKYLAIKLLRDADVEKISAEKGTDALRTDRVTVKKIVLQDRLKQSSPFSKSLCSQRSCLSERMCHRESPCHLQLAARFIKLEGRKRKIFHKIIAL